MPKRRCSHTLQPVVSIQHSLESDQNAPRMHGVIKPPPTSENNLASSKLMLTLLVLMTGVAPISLYMLVPALPVIATTFGRDISVAQMTVSLYMVGIACSQLIMGPLSD